MAEMTRSAQTRLPKALADIRSIAEEMRQRSSFHVDFEDFHVMTSAEMRDWQEIVREESGDRDYAVPTALLDLYAATGGFDFRWVCEAEVGTIRGTIRLSSLPELYQRDDEAKTSMQECMASWRRFDSVSDSEYTALRVDRGAAGVQCVYFEAGKPIRLNVSPQEYVIAAADHLGISGWQTGNVEKQEHAVRELVALK